MVKKSKNVKMTIYGQNDQTQQHFNMTKTTRNCENGHSDQNFGNFPKMVNMTKIFKMVNMTKILKMDNITRF